MITLAGIKDKNFAVLGLGRSGKAAACALKASGANVKVWDDNAEKRNALQETGIEITEPENWNKPEGIVWSPGIPHTLPVPHPVAIKAKELKTPILTDINLLNQAQNQTAYIGITGTNGKSTTTALISHILKHAGYKNQTGGNFGIPVMELDSLGKDGTYVLELSSYQLEIGNPVKSDISVLLNITPDHLDRHGNMEGYKNAKKRLFINSIKASEHIHKQTAVIGIDDEHCRQIHAWLSTNMNTVAISVENTIRGVYVKDGILIDNTDGQNLEIIDLKEVAVLPGKHNWQNAAASYAAAKARGLSSDEIATAIKSFSGLVHRQELIAEINGIKYINDSKATNADATAKALSCYENIYWIAGGLPKIGGISSLVPYFENIKHSFLIGDAAESFAKTLGKNEYTISKELDTAVEQAKEAAEKDGLKNAVVLLSPACASFDQFKDFEARGEAFRKTVMEKKKNA